MTSLNLSTNGPSISNSYNKIVNAPAPTGPAANSPTYGQWAVYTVQAPLVSAFQSELGKESVLKVQTTGEGELLDLIEEFSDGRIQFAFLKVKDSNSGLPKNVLIGWCGEGVPERTKGYFTSHLNAVSKLLHGYHVQVTARSDRDLTPDVIVQKVADASGSKYTGGGAAPASSGPRPPVASKPSMPTKSFGGTSAYQPLPGMSRGAAPSSRTDGDGWGEDAPQVSRSQLEKVDSAYKPTKVDMASLQFQKEPSRYQATQQQSSNNPDLVRGGYQPIGKVDIAAIRAQAQGNSRDERPTVVKGAYEPIGKVNIADIRRKAQGGPTPSQPPPQQSSAQDEDEQPKSLADRSAAFSDSGRLTSMPKPQVANRFGSSTSSFAGTKAPTPSAFGAKPLAGAAPVGTASKTFADEGGKTPAQIWAEKKARERGTSVGTDERPSSGAPASPIASQQSGGWQSGYGGKKWGVQIPSRTGGSGVSEQKTGNQDEEPVQEENDQPSNGTAAMRERFSQASPPAEPPALNTSTKPSAPRGVPMPGLPQRPSTNDVPQEQHQSLPAPPPRPIPADEPEEEEEDIPQGSGSPVALARPVARGPSPPPLDRAASIEPTSTRSPPPMPTDSIAEAASRMPEPSPIHEDPGRGAAQAAAASTFGAAATIPKPQSGAGKEAIAQYDYEKAEDNELELHDGERIVNIEMVDEDWWMGENERGEKGLFPSNYVELVEGGAGGAPQQEEQEEAAPPARAGGGSASAGPKGNPTATAQYDYEAAEDNELSFPDGAKITDVEFPDEDWWSGTYGGKQGLFPANYVALDE